MDTSDSEECFQSADEDFSSDDEQPVSQVSVKIPTKKDGGKKIEVKNNRPPEIDKKEEVLTEQKSNVDNNDSEQKSKEDKGKKPLEVDKYEYDKSEENCNIINERSAIIQQCFEPGMDYTIEQTKLLDHYKLGLFIPEDEDIEGNVTQSITDNDIECKKKPIVIENKKKIGVDKTQIETTISSPKKEDKINVDDKAEVSKSRDENKSDENLIAIIKDNTNLNKNTPVEYKNNDKLDAAILLPKKVDKTEIEDKKKIDSKNEPAKKKLIEGLKKVDTKPSKSDDEKADDNMWGDDEGWGWEEKQTSENKEDNLWNEDEGWGNDEGQSSDKKDDLWGDEDDWQIEDKPEETKTQAISHALDNLAINDDESSWGGWSNWGLSSVLSTAANLTSTVSQGLTTVIGVPDPEELARQHAVEKEKEREISPQPAATPTSDNKPFGLGNLVSGVTKLVETTGTKVITGGLDTMEILGKKTMEVLSQNDPGLKKKRAFLKGRKPVLSQILREAKERAEEEQHHQHQPVARKANYETIFDDHQGLVHLEALEMLSKQCDIKLENLISKSTDIAEVQETMEQIRELCELPEEDEDEHLTSVEIKERLNTAVEDINVPITYKALLKLWGDTEEWIKNVSCEESEVHQNAIETLAQLTAIAVEQFHKGGELLLIKDHRSTADEADSLVQLTITLSGLIGLAASRYCECLTELASNSGKKEEVNAMITNIYFEAANSSRYIQDAFQLLIPVLQVGAI